MRPFLSPRMLGLTLDARTAIELAARHDFEGVELLIRDLDRRGDDPTTLAALMADLGLRGGTWPLPVDWRGPEDRFRSDLNRLAGYARIAERLGLDRTGTWVLPEILDPALLDHDRPDEAAFAWHVDRLGAIAAILGDHGQRLGLEAVGVASFRSGLGRPFIDRIAALRPLVAALRDHGREVGYTVDAYHLYAAGEPIEHALHSGAAAIVSVHVSEVAEGSPADPASLRDDRRALPRPGGVVPNSELLRLLDAGHYQGPVFAEPVAGGGRDSASLDEPEYASMRIRDARDALQTIWPTASV